MIKKSRGIILALTAFSIASYLEADLTTYTWTGGYSQNNMEDPDNWVPTGGPPGVNEAALFATPDNPPILSGLASISTFEFDSTDVVITIQDGGNLEINQALISSAPYTSTFSLQPGSTLLIDLEVVADTGQFAINLNSATCSIEELTYLNDANFSISMGDGSSISLGNGSILSSLSSTSSEDILTLDGIVTVSNQTTNTIKGNISGDGSIIKQGLGLLILEGVNTYTGSTSINEGSFAVNGSVMTNVTVAAGATIQGTGSIVGVCSIENGATLAPGNSPGTLTVNTLTIEDGATTEISVTDSTASAIDVVTTATLAGTVQVNQQSGNYEKRGSYTIVSASAIEGQFSQVMGGLKGFSFSLEQTENSVLLNYLAQIPTEGLSGQALAVANYLNEHAPSSKEYMELVALSGNTLSEALHSVSSVRNSYASFAAQQTLFGINEMITSHLGKRRLMANRPSSLPSVASLMQSGEDLYADAGHLHVRPSALSTAPNDLWIGGFAQSAKQLQDHNQPSFHFLSEGCLIGYDYNHIEDTSIGIAIGYAHSYLSSHQYRTRASTQYYFSSLYSSYSWNNFYVEPAFLAAFHHIHNHRTISFSTFHAVASSTMNGWQIDPHLGLGYDISTSWGEIEPFASVDYAISWEGSSHERGASSLNMQQKKHRSSFLRTEAGVRIYEDFATSWGRFGAKQGLSYLYKKPFKTGSVTASITGSGAFFTLNTLQKPENQGSISLELFSEIGHKAPVCLSASYVGEFGGQYLSNEWMLTIGRNF